MQDLGKFFKDAAESIVNLDNVKATELAQQAIDEDLNLLEVVEKGFGEGIKKVGDLWDEGEFFLPELMRGAQIMQEAIDILTPKLRESGHTRKTRGTVIMATIEGDIHSIGKTIVGTILRANGFEVIDLGVDVKAEKIVDEAIKQNATLIGVSTLLTTTMVNQKKVLDLLEEKNLRKKIKIMLGGAPVTAKWALEDCKADGFADNAVEAAKVAKNLLK
ncbi:MAG: Trimethylamine corrinoid protein [Candidatus Heimdallarchaeota archaeon LC_3]|nr:MAG: Trimethylamine corrinoid protein [Candidatus Heimdallarchaeota archaeon LC_3]